jgi:thioesterase domain-containing protein
MALRDQTVTNPSTGARKAAGRTLQDLENGLRWGETLWISNKRPIKRTIVAFHNADTADFSRLPCFMLPSLPQLSTDYIELAKMMEPEQPFFAVYLPSEKRNPESTSSVYKLARYYADEIDKFYPRGPLAVGGWSAGGIVARLTAQLLKQSGRDVPLLVVIDGALPTVDAGPRGLFEKIKVSYCRTFNIGRNVVELGRDVARRRRQQRPENSGLAQIIKSAWHDSSLKLNCERIIDAVAPRMRTQQPAQDAPQRHPAENASNISSMPPEHKACAITLYDAIFGYVPDEIYTGRVVLYESTAEPDRGSERVVRKWAKISKNLTVVPVKGDHMSMVKRSSGLPLARDLSKRLREYATKDREQSLPSHSGENTVQYLHKSVGQ